jgi:hypothetical protein
LGRQPVEFLERHPQAHAEFFRQATLGLVQDEGAGEQAEQLAVAGVQLLPEAALLGRVAAKPLLSGGGGLCGGGFHSGWRCFGARRNHGALQGENRREKIENRLAIEFCARGFPIFYFLSSFSFFFQPNRFE